MTISIVTVTTRDIKQNGYIVYDDEKTALIIDPGFDPELYLNELESRDLNLQAILATHAHFDHIGAVYELMKYCPAEFYLHSAELPILKKASLFANILNSGEQIATPNPNIVLKGEDGNLKLGNFYLDWMKFPGHTPGSLCFMIENNIFTGDLILPKGHFSNRLPGSDHVSLKSSLEKISKLNADLMAYPGHGKLCTLGRLIAKFSGK